MPLRPTLPSALDDAEDSKPYVLAQPAYEDRGRAKGQGNAVVRIWRRQLGGIQKLFRKINQAAYLVSVPFLMILVFGAVVGSRQIALFGATAVVLLNIGRLVAGIANLAIVPFRDGINMKQDEEAGLARDRAGPDDRPGGPGVHLHPLALAAVRRPRGASPTASAPPPRTSRRT